MKTFLELPRGIPSGDTINRVFSSIDNDQFERCFVQWVSEQVDLTKGEVIPIDGKTIRGAKSHGKKLPIHMVSAWACESNLVLGQIKTAEKSNEITAIPQLLGILDIAGQTLTIDAMGTQKGIAEKIIKNDANYILAVKANQAHLLENIKDEFKFAKQLDISVYQDLGHGRIETRTCSVITDFKFIESQNDWKDLTSIIRVESVREFKNSDKKTEKATRYYISNLEDKANVFQTSIRSHWAVENKLHWILDVSFGEDASRKRNKNAAQNYSVLLKIALNLLKNEKQKSKE